MSLCYKCIYTENEVLIVEITCNRAGCLPDGFNSTRTDYHLDQIAWNNTENNPESKDWESTQPSRLTRLHICLLSFHWISNSFRQSITASKELENTPCFQQFVFNLLTIAFSWEIWVWILKETESGYSVSWVSALTTGMFSSQEQNRTSHCFRNSLAIILLYSLCSLCS